MFPSLLHRNTCWRKGRAACCRPSARGRAPTAAPPVRSAPPLPPSVSPSSPRPPRPPRLLPTTAGPADTSSAKTTTTKTMKTRARLNPSLLSGEGGREGGLQLVLPVNWAVESRGFHRAPASIFFVCLFMILLWNSALQSRSLRQLSPPLLFLTDDFVLVFFLVLTVSTSYH